MSDELPQRAMSAAEATVTLFRPVGQAESDMNCAAGFCGTGFGTGSAPT
jgi:hypothetical protein